jgi:2-oxoglutarate dehydrogenase E1 component
MAHRGRLNVLANTMGKTYEHIFSEFEGTAKPDLTMGDGDVKYHMGYSSQLETPSGKLDVKLCPNPSHLEAVNPVVIGFSRAKADHNYQADLSKVLPILIHGDAAVAGQGVVYEVTQMAGLEGFATGGTLHFVINNQVGFTTDFDDARTSTYCTDVAKTIMAPVMHVNGDDPEAVVFCAELATEFRQRFAQDVFIDMVCYRRHGHNESDEPKFTQPTFYNLIGVHKNPRDLYSALLAERGELDAALAQQMDKNFRATLQDRLNQVKQQPLPYVYQKLEEDWKGLRKSTPEDFHLSPITATTPEVIQKVAQALTTVPEGFKPLKQIEKLLEDRRKMFAEGGQLNWAAAELLAYGTLLEQGNQVRLTGQDVQRGTFSHRHAVLHDAETNREYNSLNSLTTEGEGKLNIYNSLLSEYGVLGFEFGYAMANPNALVIWEAQFGDFANGAQTMIDQFISCSESKWQRMTGLVCLLPHGYEGQGPEHSNARPERFLQLSAEYNMFVVNITDPANFFHLLRRQLALPFRKPCIVMSPKSMLRLPAAVSEHGRFTSGGFIEVLADTTAGDPKKVRRVVLCSGKLYYELAEAARDNNLTDVAIIRLEQLAPFPAEQLALELAKYKKAELIWAQEEPENMGPWSFILRMLYVNGIQLVARKPSASPATGYSKVHVKEQEEIIARALAIPKTAETKEAVIETAKEAQAQG